MNILFSALVPVPSHLALAVHGMALCETLADMGHNVTFACLPPTEDNRSQDAFSVYGTRPIFDLSRVQMSKVRGLAGIVWGRKARLAAAQDGSPIDLIYSCHIYTLLASAHTGIPLVYEVHQMPSNRFQEMLMNLVFQLPNFRRLTAISRALADDMIARFPVLRKKDVVLTRVAAYPRFDEAPKVRKFGRLSVGYVGNMYPGKGLELIAGLTSLLPEVDFDIVGGRPEAVSKWRELIPHENVTFHGYVPHAETKRFLDRFDLVLLPLQNRVSPDGGTADISRWTSPQKLFEYMGSGKAILASDLPVIREVLKSGENAILLPKETPEDWAEAIRQLDANRDRLDALGAGALNDLHQKYNWHTRMEAALSGLDI